MLPEARNDDLLYVHDLTGVFVYSYPGGKLVGQLAYSFGQQAGLCVDAAGDVFIPDPTSAQIFEFVHGGRRPKATLMDTGYVPQGCAVDPKSGDLAVTGNGIGRGSGGLAIYRRARGNPQVFTDKRFRYYEFCTFDDSGNLYFDGDDSLRNRFAFARFSTRIASFSSVRLNVKLAYPGGVQWDGKYVDVSDMATPYIYRFSVSGDAGILAHRTPIDEDNYPAQFVIQGKRVVANDLYYNRQPDQSAAMFYHFPLGGIATKIVLKDLDYAYGLALSLSKPSLSTASTH